MRSLIQNREPRRDSSGAIIDAHDGCLEYFDGVYHLYGTQYADTNGFTQLNRYVCYTSRDLREWHFEGDILPAARPANRFRPYVKHCPATGKYVLWYYWGERWIGALDFAAGEGPTVPFQFGVATSDAPTGPFTTVRETAKISRASGGDHNLFVDEDGTGYLIYTWYKEKCSVIIERLTPDFLDTTGEVSAPIADVREAPILFRRGNYYYALAGDLCAFCPHGAGAEVYRAESPLGPYEFRGDINRDAEGNIIIPGQQTHISRLHGQEDEDTLIWMADLWHSTPDGLKGHDIQYWSAPLEVDEAGDLRTLRRVDEWELPL